jgi:triacylglycerol lipase
MWKRTAGLAVLVALFPAAPSVAAPGPKLSPAPSKLRHSLSCKGDLRHSERKPVLLVHGTFADSKINWSWNYKKTLPERGQPACTVDLPDLSSGDIQPTSEYVVYAIRAMAKRRGGKIDVIGLSQGGLNIRWALRWWPDLRRLVDDAVLFVTPNHGAKFTDVVCTGPGICASALYQMRSDSIFLAALNRGRDTVPGVDYTEIATSDDTIFVTPRQAHLDGARNIVIQHICPGHKVDHVGTAYDGPTYAFAIDALDHRGPANPNRVGPKACRRDTMPGTTRAQAEAKVNAYQSKLSVLLGPTGPKARGEPQLAPYAR